MRVSNRSAAHHIANLDRFTNSAGSFRGEDVLTTYDYKQGRLSDDLFKMLCQSGAKYVIYSYGTPIAWISAHGKWFVPEIRYSVTTSKHQSIVRGAVA